MSTTPEDEAQIGNDIETNVENLREIDRVIASVLVFSSDGYLLIGRKDPSKGGVYPDAWHIPGGGIEQGETLEDAAAREVGEEAGLVISKDDLLAIPNIGSGSTVKTLPTGERVWCKMSFNRYELHLGKTANELSEEARPGGDLIELRWFPRDELNDVKQIPGGKEFFMEQGYIQ